MYYKIDHSKSEENENKKMRCYEACEKNKNLYSKSFRFKVTARIKKH